MNEEAQGGEDVSEGADGLVDLEVQQVRVKHFFHQRVLPIIMLQPFLQKKRRQQELNAPCDHQMAR